MRGPAPCCGAFRPTRTHSRALRGPRHSRASVCMCPYPRWRKCPRRMSNIRAARSAGDGWNFSCFNPNTANCPENPGEDLDFGSSPILKNVGGKDLLIVGQKSGVVHALDPAQLGKIVWQVRVGRGGALGGIEWGSAADDENIYVALSDQTPLKPEMGGR